MGTRSLTFVYDGDKPIINMYRQFDGYLEGHGLELAEFLMSGESVGGFYIHAVTDTECWQDYEYHVYENRVLVKNPGVIIFSGTYKEFSTFCSTANVRETA